MVSLALLSYSLQVNLVQAMLLVLKESRQLKGTVMTGNVYWKKGNGKKRRAFCSGPNYLATRYKFKRLDNVGSNFQPTKRL